MTAKILLDKVSENREAFQALHVSGEYYGSSTIANILGLGFKSPLQEWAERTGKVRVEDISQKPAVKRGTMLEPVVGRMYAEETGNAVKPFDKVLQHPDASWAIASPDFIEVQSGAIVEAKTAANPRGWDGSAPAAYICQVQWQMGICQDRDRAILAGLMMDSFDLRIFPVDYDKDFYEHLMEKALQFREMVKLDLPPEAGPGDMKLLNDTLAKIEKGRSVKIENCQHLIDRYENLMARKQQASFDLKPIEAEIDAVKAQLKQVMGTAEVASIGGYTVKLQRVEVKASEGYSYTKMTIKGVK